MSGSPLGPCVLVETLQTFASAEYAAHATVVSFIVAS